MSACHADDSDSNSDLGVQNTHSLTRASQKNIVHRFLVLQPVQESCKTMKKSVKKVVRVGSLGNLPLSDELGAPIGMKHTTGEVSSTGD